MQKARQLSLFTAITLWAILIGSVVYSHITFFPSYLSHLPESNKLITGEYGLNVEIYWMLIHPFTILSTIITLILNWKLKSRRKFILIACGIYSLAIIATVFYFVPEIKAFAGINNNATVTTSEWCQRGQTWEYRSWIRGFCIYIGFVMLLVALTKDKAEDSKL